MFKNYSDLLNEDGKAIIFYHSNEEDFVSRFIYPAAKDQIGNLARFEFEDEYRLSPDYLDFLAKLSGRYRSPDFDLISPSHIMDRVLLAQK